MAGFFLGVFVTLETVVFLGALLAEGWVFAEDILAELLAGAFALTVEAFEVFLVAGLVFDEATLPVLLARVGVLDTLFSETFFGEAFLFWVAFTLVVLVFLFVEGILEWLDLNPPIEFGAEIYVIFLFLLIEFEVRLYCDYLNLVL